jgi:hypothetical protein
MIVQFFQKIFSSLHDLFKYIRGFRLCGLCKEKFLNKENHAIYFRYPNGEVEEMAICLHCATILEVSKMRGNNEAPITTDRP